MLTATATDGFTIRAFDDGSGPGVLVLHPGRDDGTSWRKVATRLSSRFRVVRLQRRPYRLDLRSNASWTIADEVSDVLAIADVIGKPAVIVGHSSGGVVALEALVASPGTFAGAVLYEPPVIIGPPLGGEALVRARAALDAGKPGRALAIFLGDIVGLPSRIASLVGAIESSLPRRRAFISPQIADCEAVERLGNRLGAYAGIDVPVVLFGGDRSPDQFGERLDALARTIPNSERVVLRGRGHYAQRFAPDEVADLVGSLAGRALR